MQNKEDTYGQDSETKSTDHSPKYIALWYWWRWRITRHYVMMWYLLQVLLMTWIRRQLVWL